MRRGARGALPLVLALVAASCSARQAGPRPTPTFSLVPTATADEAPGGTGTPRRQSPRPHQTATRQPSHDPGGTAYFDGAGVGAMARSYLRAAPARRLVVEVDFVSGRRPDQSALDHLGALLGRECDKPEGVVIERGNEIPVSRSRYTFSDIETLERAHRARHSSGETATMWIVYLNGDLSGEEGTLGVSYRASAAALFADRIQGAATALVRPGSIERSVLAHEAGHLLALVNIGYQSAHDHEDPGHPKHSSNRGSVMYWAIEDVSVASILGGGPPDDFDSFDRDDLRMLRSG